MGARDMVEAKDMEEQGEAAQTARESEIGEASTAKMLDRSTEDMTPEELAAYQEYRYMAARRTDYFRAVELEMELHRKRAVSERLEKAKKLPIFRISAPFRAVFHFLRRWKWRLRMARSYPSFREGWRRMMLLVDAKRYVGTGTFPSARERDLQQSTVFTNRARPDDPEIKFSILVPLYNTPERFLKEMIESVQAQTYRNWELCLADGSTAAYADVEEICRSYQENDPRIVYRRLQSNEGIAGNTNECFRMATGNYIALFDHDDLLHPSALYEYARVIAEQDADYIYCDETTFRGLFVDDVDTMHFKPEFAIDNLRAHNYICHFSVFSRELLAGEDGCFRPECDGAQDHDMTLRLTARARNIVHIPKMLYYWRIHEGSSAGNIESKLYAVDGAKRAIFDHLKSQGYRNNIINSSPVFATIFHIKYEIEGEPLVSVILQERDGMEKLCHCLESFIDKSFYRNFEIIVLSDTVKEEALNAFLAERFPVPADRDGTGGGKSAEGKPRGTGENPDVPDDRKQYKVRVVTREGLSPAFPCGIDSAADNRAAAEYAKGDYLLFLDGNTDVMAWDWMEQLVMYAQRRDVAFVGGLLRYPQNETVQSAGVTIGFGKHRAAGYFHYGLNRGDYGYMSKLCYVQDISAVDAACTMVKRSVWEELGGLSCEYADDLDMVDLCLRAREKGYLNIFNPYVEMHHDIPLGAGNDLLGNGYGVRRDEEKRFKARWRRLLEDGDPYFNVNMSLDESGLAFRKRQKSI